MKVHYLYHSGFAVDTGNHFLIFDYWKDTPAGGGLADGVVNPEELVDRDVLVFASHAHPDHYNPVILGWQQKAKRLRLYLSDDIPAAKGAVMMKHLEVHLEPGLRVETLASTDQGVAFVVEVDGVVIYHAGDLNWWHWEGEPDEFNKGMAKSYQAKVARLAGREIDLAFVPVDPRLGNSAALLGLDHLMGVARIKAAIPIHFGDTPVSGLIAASPSVAPYRDRIFCMETRGQTIDL